MEIDQAKADRIRINFKKTTFLFYPDCDNLPDKPESAVVVMLACPSDKAPSLTDSTTKLVIDGAGEYELDDFSIQGVQVSDEPLKNVYRLTSPDGVKVALLPDIKVGMLTDKVLEELGVIDLLIIAVGQKGSDYSPVETAKVVRTLAPRVVIPLTDNKDIIEEVIKEVGGTVHNDEKIFKSKILPNLEEGQHIYVLG